MIWLQGWTVTTRRKGNSQRATKRICTLFFNMKTNSQPHWFPTPSWKIHKAKAKQLVDGQGKVVQRGLLFLLSFPVFPWTVGVWGVERGTLAGSLIGRQRALWPQWCRVTGETRGGDWPAASAVECATSGVPEWKRAAWSKTLLFVFLLNFSLSSSSCLLVLS